MFLGQVLKSMLRPEMKDNSSCMINCFSFSVFFFFHFFPLFWGVKEEHGFYKVKKVHTASVLESLLLCWGLVSFNYNKFEGFFVLCTFVS